MVLLGHLASPDRRGRADLEHAPRGELLEDVAVLGEGADRPAIDLDNDHAPTQPGLPGGAILVDRGDEHTLEVLHSHLTAVLAAEGRDREAHLDDLLRTGVGLGELRRDGGEVVFSDGRLTIPLGSLEGADAYPDRVTVGVRPENLEFADGGSVGVLDVTVELVEPLGSEIYLHGNASGQSIVARIGPDHPLEVGETVRLAADPSRIHFFDGESGASLRPAAASVET